jgi:ParB family chromosome partitioning protein
VPLNDLRTNAEQPRQGGWEDDSLMRQIIEAGGVTEPLYVQPDGEILDGHRRWVNSMRILDDIDARERKGDINKEQAAADRERFGHVNVEETDRNLTPQEKLRAWVLWHRQRKEWSLHERERTAYRLLDAYSRTEAAALLGVSMRDFTKLLETYEYMEVLAPIMPSGDKNASVTWAREIAGMAAKYKTDDIVGVFKQKIADGKMTNSKEIRDVRRILDNEAAMAVFKDRSKTMQEAVATLPQPSRPATPAAPVTPGAAFKSNLRAVRPLFEFSWQELVSMKGDPEVKEILGEYKTLIANLETALA